MTTAQTKRRAILAFMLDRSGVLNKVFMLIRRKMINVDTITACATQQPGISRITLTLREDSDDKALQLIKQMEKLTEVISAKELDIDQSFWREVAVVKFETGSEHLDRLGQNYNFEILDRQDHEVIVAQVAGTSLMIDNFMAEIGPDKIIEVARSGFTAMEK
ncbi:acetolactate synthase small subunit [bacterium]|nr:acetolactate synthase small subunit [bacterium]